jgi:hypothetical protein
MSRSVGVLKAPTSRKLCVTAKRPSSEKPAEGANIVSVICPGELFTLLTNLLNSMSVAATPLL